MADLSRLLDVQDNDLALDQLRHRRANLPQRAALVATQTSLTSLGAERQRIQAQLDELARSQKRLEDEITSIETKAGSETRKLNSGSVTAPREIQALSSEIDALGRRQRTLEDEILEIMEAVEPLSAEVERLDAESATATSDLERLRGEIDEQERAIDGEIAAAEAARAGAAAGLDAALLERYEKLRAKLGGIAVARLEGDRCLGCHVSLPAVEVDVIRHSPPDAIVTHEDCGRILVR